MSSGCRSVEHVRRMTARAANSALTWVHQALCRAACRKSQPVLAPFVPTSNAPVVPSIASPFVIDASQAVLEVVLPNVSHLKFDGRFERFDKFEFIAIDKVTRHLILVVVEVRSFTPGTL